MNSCKSHVGVPFYWLQTGPTSVLSFFDTTDDAAGRLSPVHRVAGEDIEESAGGRMRVSWDTSGMIGTTFVEVWDIRRQSKG